MKKIGLALLVFLFSHGAWADSYWTGSPLSWRLQNYVNGNVVVWKVSGLPANCPQGSGLSTNTLSASDKSRFYATVMAAKLTSHAMYLYYAPTTCEITSFGMDN